MFLPPLGLWCGGVGVVGFVAADGFGAGAGVGVEEHQRGSLDADADSATSEDFRGKQSVGTEGDQAS